MVEGSKIKNQPSRSDRKEMIDINCKELSVRAQCMLASISKSTYYYNVSFV